MRQSLEELIEAYQKSLYAAAFNICRKNVEYGWWILYIMETVQDTGGQDYGKTQNESKKIL